MPRGSVPPADARGAARYLQLYLGHINTDIQRLRHLHLLLTRSCIQCGLPWPLRLFGLSMQKDRMRHAYSRSGIPAHHRAITVLDEQRMKITYKARHGCERRRDARRPCSVSAQCLQRRTFVRLISHPSLLPTASCRRIRSDAGRFSSRRLSPPISILPSPDTPSCRFLRELARPAVLLP